MTALILDDGVRKALDELRRHAEACPYTLAMMHEVAAGRLAPAGDDPAFFRLVPHNYRVVLTVEQHPPCQPGGQAVWLRHASVSLTGVKRGRVPPIPAMAILLPVLGFWQPLDECHVWTEDTGPAIAVNVIGLLNRPGGPAPEEVPCPKQS